ncbi:MAG: HAD-IA family hydrolase [Anaerolineae bacterium]|nr:HAD-IA family hydrolase [Anaerolineae bacterium]
MIHYLIWDAGGTLFDTYPAIVGAFLEVLDGYGVAVSRAEVLHLARTATQHAISTLAARFALDVTVFERRFRQAYDNVAAVAQPPFPGVVSVCAAVCRNGGANYIVTHRGRDSLLDLLQVHDMQRFFADWITREDPFPRKPHPAAVNAMLERHHLDPAEALLIGDRMIDIQAGKAAGIHTCFFGDPSTPPEVDIHIQTYAELLDWLFAETGAFR